MKLSAKQTGLVTVIATAIATHAVTRVFDTAVGIPGQLREIQQDLENLQKDVSRLNFKVFGFAQVDTKAPTLLPKSHALHSEAFAPGALYLERLIRKLERVCARPN